MNSVERIGKYDVVSELGRGGMGIVYKGFDSTLQRHVAIKVLAPHLAEDDGVQRRFLTEARAAASLQHQNIVAVYEAGEDAGRFYFVMELIEGEDLADLLKRRGTIDVSTALTYLSRIAEALDYAHQKGIVHRDVKPENILLSGSTPKVADFGIARIAGAAKHTQTGMIIGTVHYLAPEIWNGKEASRASDVYAFGIVAYELLFGRKPFDGDSPMTIAWHHVHSPVPKPDMTRVQGLLNPRTAAIFGKVLAKSAQERYATCGEFTTALKQTEPQRPAHRITAAISAVGALAVVGSVLIYANVHSKQPPPPPPNDRFALVIAEAGDALRSIQKFPKNMDELPKHLGEHERDMDTMLADGKQLEQQGKSPEEQAAGAYYVGVHDLISCLSLYQQRDFSQANDRLNSGCDELEHCLALGKSDRKKNAALWAYNIDSGLSNFPDKGARVDSRLRQRLRELSTH